MEMEGKHTRVPCLFGIVDLLKICRQENIRISSDSNQYLVYMTLNQLGPVNAQKIVNKLVENGIIEWREEFEVESIIDHTVDEGIEYYLIKWKGWSSAYNNWEPKENLGCDDMLTAFHEQKCSNSLKRSLEQDDKQPVTKKKRLDDLFKKVMNSSAAGITPLELFTLCDRPALDKFKNDTMGRVNKIYQPKIRERMVTDKKNSHAYKRKRGEVKSALTEWEIKLNEISTDSAKIYVENDVDLEGPPDNFEYINDYLPGNGIIIPQDPLIGCECEDCFATKHCCCPENSGSEFPYYRHKRVRVPRGRPIYECNKRCKCGPDCPNRVVQFGRKVKVCIFRTANSRGWGVKSLQRIKKGSFVMEYVGEVITSEEAETRGKRYDAEGRTYLFDLDYNKDDCPFTVDAGYYGNVSHFVNHSCDPNLEVFGVWINTLDPRLPRIALFSRKDIQKGEELTFDYLMTGDTTKQMTSMEAELDPISPPKAITEEYRIVCQCGAKNCRKYLF